MTLLDGWTLTPSASILANPPTPTCSISIVTTSHPDDNSRNFDSSYRPPTTIRDDAPPPPPPLVDARDADDLGGGTRRTGRVQESHRHVETRRLERHHPTELATPDAPDAKRRRRRRHLSGDAAHGVVCIIII